MKFKKPDTSYWDNKFAVYLHDPFDKVFQVKGHGERAASLLEIFGLQSPNEEFWKKADSIAAGFEVPVDLLLGTPLPSSPDDTRPAQQAVVRAHRGRAVQSGPHLCRNRPTYAHPSAVKRVQKCVTCGSRCRRTVAEYGEWRKDRDGRRIEVLGVERGNAVPGQ